MTIPPRGEAALPGWVLGSPFAVWVCDAEGRLVFANPRARALLGNGHAEPGRPCHESVAGVDQRGRELCGEHCALRGRVLARERPEPLLMRLQGHGRWALVVPIVLEEERPEQALIVHCAHDLDPFVRAIDYIERVAARSRPVLRPGHCLELLTPREREILSLCARDEDNHSIARALHVSLVTVRNHVQHVLAKLGAHSIQEAVALWLLEGGEPRPPAPRGGGGAGSTTDPQA